MSRYCVVKTMFTDLNALVAALTETGNWTLGQIERHAEPQHLFGFCGDQRSEKANIIIRRKSVGIASNDMGFVLNEDGNYEAIISQYDSRKYGKKWIGELTANYAFHKVRREMEPRGRSVVRERRPNGYQRIVVTGYR